MMNAEILGFSVIDSGPVGAVHLPYHSGLTVLYGQNGAGKSYVLRGVTSALSGIRSDAGHALVHIRVDDDYYWDPELDADGDTSSGQSLGSEIGVALTEAVRSALTNRLFLDRDRVDDFMDEVYSPMKFSVAATALAHLKVGGGVEDLVSSPVPIARAFGTCRTVSLQAIGESEPAWRLFLAGCSDENARELRQAIGRVPHIDSLLRAFEDREDRVVAVMDAIWGTESSVDELSGFVERFINEIDRFSEDLAERVHRLQESERDSKDDAALFHDMEEAGLEVLLKAELNQAGSLAPALSVDRGTLQLYGGFDPQFTPAWTPMPLIEFDTTTTDVGLPRVIGGIEGDTVARLTERIHNHPSVVAKIAAAQKRVDEFVGGQLPTPFTELHIAENLTSVLGTALGDMTEPVVREANRLLESTVPDSPFLQAAGTDLTETLQGTWLRWEAFDTPSMQWVPVSELSDAQRRWVDVALDFGDSANSPNGAFLVIDEPERALHRGAIGQLAARLPEFSASRGIATLVATHAPEFIASQNAAVHHVTRTADPFGRSRVIPLESAARTEIASAAETLGLAPADLLQLTRAFILVEGEHDKVVIDALLDDVLYEQHARTIAIRGVDSLTTLLDSEVLIPYTSARLVIVFDHITDPKALGTAWDEARRIAQRDPAVAIKQFGGAIGELQRAASPTKEDAAAVNLAFGLLRAGYAARVDLFGFTKPGIEKYLPIREFSDDPEVTWEHLGDEYMAQPLGKRQRENEKDWLRRVHDIEVTTDTVRAAASSMDGGDISDEFTDLADVIRTSGRPSVD